MDLASLKEAAANLSLYDLKAGVRKVQNAVMNYTEMEAKVREATNNEPWGASSSLMQEIANGTYNYQLLNEIMPMIYKRFTEKAAEEWRQIYKALQLLEFLIKNGSERVIDDARSHLTLLKMLRQFHFIDPNGKDQGLNVRNRAKELADLLSDVDRIRAERKKARTTRNKYTGVEGGAGLGGGLSSGSRYGGFGSEEQGGYGGYSGGVYGDGGGFGGQSSDFQDTGSRGDSGGPRRDRFDEYDEYDEGAVAAPGRRQAESSAASSSRRKTTESVAKKAEPPKKKEPEVDLFSFDDPIPTSAPVVAPIAAGASNAADEDDFDDFQSATPSVQPAAPTAFSPLSQPTATTTATTQYAAPQPISAPKQANLSDLVGFSSISPAPTGAPTPVNYSSFSTPAAPAAQQPKPTAYQGSQPNYFTSVQVPTTQTKPALGASSAKSPAAAKPSSGQDAFGSLWSTASSGVKKTTAPTAGPALGQLAKEKASAGIWGAGSSTNTAPPQQRQNPAAGQQKLGGGLDDLLG
ncbi:Uncharacterized protein BP5553_02478 [Venustampulla echinocandica]|uniref:ENTH domain-containing protein n=1 Tax=Venustampulla echinocandica TaxID=2656787 RepID=A0A370U3Z9_9HELO|nr:Uncharacterized protein BP5553_02478 [Venustampulla echinocandica]RDL42499.1 Uncharacterized protein BP5553_02478 [Venustampulla echinocandica]